LEEKYSLIFPISNQGQELDAFW